MWFVVFHTCETKPSQFDITCAKFRNCVCFSEKRSELILQILRPHLLFKLASILLKFISQDEDVSVLFLCASILTFILQESLDEVDLSQMFIDSQSSESGCFVCMDGYVGFYLCPFCGESMCADCFTKIRMQSNKLCPNCRSPRMFNSFEKQRQHNSLLWAEILFFSMFKRHIHEFDAQKVDVQSLTECLTAFLQQHEPFRFSPVMCIARWDSVEVSAEVASDCVSDEVGSDCANAMYD